jgi:uracil-DNA glycosylase
MLIESLQFHSSWAEFFTQERLNQVKEIGSRIGSLANPSPEKVFRFTGLNIDSLKCVILGQDPYPQEGVATGRSFEVGTLASWAEPFGQHSLKNIIRLIHKTYYGELISFKEIRTMVEAGQAPILPPGEWFNDLERQGVLFLNTYLTCEINKPNSHRMYWSNFSKDLLEYISTRNNNLHWFLWGKEAQNNEAHIKHGIIHRSNIHDFRPSVKSRS